MKQTKNNFTIGDDGQIIGRDTQEFDGKVVHLPQAEAGKYRAFFDGLDGLPNVVIMPRNNWPKSNIELCERLKSPEVPIEDKIKVVGMFASLATVIVDKDSCARLPSELVKQAELGDKIDVTGAYTFASPGYSITDHGRLDAWMS
ncbi:MAG: hypothetical protein LBL08_03860 [Candidatus Nomurabacteria bacterium]|nr:hypothetical protein [Candidatus Nomurabacteria bacterium]